MRTKTYRSRILFTRKLLETEEPTKGFLSLLKHVALFSHIYEEIKGELPKLPGYDKRDIITEEVNLLWEELMHIRQSLPEILIEDLPITITKEGKTHAVSRGSWSNRIRPTNKKKRFRKTIKKS